MTNYRRFFTNSAVGAGILLLYLAIGAIIRLFHPIQEFHLPIAVLILALFFIFRGAFLSAQENEDLIFSFFLLTLFFLPLPTFFELFLIIGIVFSILSKHPLQWKMEKVDFLLILFILISLVSALFSQNKPLAFSGVFIFIFYFFLMNYSKNIRIKESQEQALLLSLSMGLILWTAFAILHYLIGAKLILSLGSLKAGIFQATDGQGNLQSVFDFSSFGGYLVTWINLLLIHLLEKNHKKQALFLNLTAIGALGLSLIFVFLTGGRGAFLLLFLFIFVYLIKARYFKFLLGSALFFFLLLLVPNQKWQNTIKNIGNPSKLQNMGGRIQAYRIAWDIYKENNPFIGIGLINFTDYFKEKNLPAYENNRLPFLNNNYLAILLETGLFGALAFWIFIFALLLSLIRERRSPFAFLGMVSIAAFLLTSFLESLIYHVPTGILIWAYFGLARNRFIEIKGENS